MVNYQNAKIYKIVDNTNGNIYVGSTCEPTLARRLTGHVGNYKRYLKGNHNYVTSFDIMKNNDYDIILLENCPCESKDQLHARERFYVETLDCINKNITGRTRQETCEKYREKNKDKIQKYRVDNINKTKLYNEEYRNNHAEKLKNYQKNYRIEYKDKLQQKQKQYHIDHKKEIQQYQRTKCDCECGGEYMNANKSRHMKSPKHKNNKKKK